MKNKKLIFLLCISVILLLPFISFAQTDNRTPEYRFWGVVGINTQGYLTLKDTANYAMQIGDSSLGKGMILPIGNSLTLPPVKGGFVYNLSDSSLYYSDGNKWNDINNKLFINVKDYGAKGDSTTDDTHAIQNAFNSVPSNGAIVFFPAGKYLISDSITISNTCTILGTGGIMTYNQSNSKRNNSSSQIIQTVNGLNGFVINAPGVQFDNVGLLNISNNPISGNGIKFNNGNEFRINNCHVNNFYININLINGVYWGINNSEIQDAVLYNMSIADSVQPDGGDGYISNSYFTSGRYAGTISIIQYSGGGLRINSSKFQGSNDATNPPLGFYYADLTHGTSILLINQCSFEYFSGFAIKFVNNTSQTFQSIIISNNEFNEATSFSDNQIISISTNNPGFIEGVIINGNTIKSYNSSQAVNYFNGITNLSIYGNQLFTPNNSLLSDSIVNCTNVSTRLEGLTNEDSVIVKNGTVTSPSIQIGSRSLGIYSSAPNRIDFSSNGSNNLTILPNGNLVSNGILSSIIFNNYRDYSSNTTGFSLTSNSISFYISNSSNAGFNSSSNLYLKETPTGSPGTDSVMVKNSSTGIISAISPTYYSTATGSINLANSNLKQTSSTVRNYNINGGTLTFVDSTLLHVIPPFGNAYFSDNINVIGGYSPYNTHYANALIGSNGGSDTLNSRLVLTAANLGTLTGAFMSQLTLDTLGMSFSASSPVTTVFNVDKIGDGRFYGNLGIVGDSLTMWPKTYTMTSPTIQSFQTRLNSSMNLTALDSVTAPVSGLDMYTNSLSLELDNTASIQASGVVNMITGVRGALGLNMSGTTTKLWSANANIAGIVGTVSIFNNANYENISAIAAASPFSYTQGTYTKFTGTIDTSSQLYLQGNPGPTYNIDGTISNPYGIYQASSYPNRFSGGIQMPILVVTTSTTVTKSNYSVINASGTNTFTIPAASSCSGQVFHFVCNTGTITLSIGYLNYSGTSTTTIAAGSGVTIQSNGISYYQIGQ